MHRQRFVGHRSTTRIGGPRVLFVCHEASRTGAPIMFLHFLRWLAENTELNFEILLLADGPIASEFAAIAPTHLVEALGAGPASYVEAGIAKAGFPVVADRMKVARSQRSLTKLGRFDALYLNSATSALALRILPEVPPLVFSHIHELRSAFNYWFPDRDRRTMIAATDWFIACSDAVADNLVGGYEIERERVSRHYEFIRPPVVDQTRAQELRASIGVGPDAFLVGASGMVIWRKGPDLFVQCAAAVMESNPTLDVHFVWIGGAGDEHIPVESDIAKLGLEGRVHFIGELTDPGDLFSTLDAFCVTSREDPYPLVMLEAAALGVPVVSFANGGAVEFAGDPETTEHQRARIVPYLDADAMGDAIDALLADPEGRKSLGKRGQARVLGEHTIEVGAAGLYRELMDRMGSPMTTAARATTAMLDVPVQTGA